MAGFEGLSVFKQKDCSIVQDPRDSTKEPKESVTQRIFKDVCIMYLQTIVHDSF